ncbi:unnamed protein product, partial [Symbiodinium necroappetens]
DMDGDDNCITTQLELVEFLRFTKPWEDKPNWEDIGRQALHGREGVKPGFCAVPVGPGHATARPRHCLECELPGRSGCDGQSDGPFDASLGPQSSWACKLCFSVTDCPKRGLLGSRQGASVLHGAVYLWRCGFKGKAEESMNSFPQDKHVLVAGSACDMGPPGVFGKAWFPQDKIALGAECILRHKRRVDHCVLTELSHVLVHKSGMSSEDWSQRKLLTVRRKVNEVPYFVIRCLAR